MMSESIQVPEGYKKTEVGIIPEEWEVEELGNVCNFYDHLRVPIKKADRMKRCGSYPYYGAQSIIDWIDGYLFDGNYLLIAEDGENLKSKVLPIAYQVSGKFWVNNHAHIIKPKDNNKIGYLEYILNFVDMEKYITGSAQPKLNQNTAKKIKIQLPFPEEQQKIASILSKVDEQIERTEQIIERTELLKAGLMQKLLTKGIGHTKFKKTELGEIPEEWGIFQIDQLTNINRESRDPTKNSEELFNYIDIDAVENGTGLIKNPKRLFGREAPSRARRVIHNDDVIMSTVRPYHKAFSLVTHLYDNQICSTGFAVLSCGKNVYPKYLLQYLFSDHVIDQCTSMMAGGQYPALNTTQVSKIKIAIPPLAEQQKIASILSKVDSQVQDNQSYLTRLQELKKGLMQDLLTGKVRVCV